MTNGWIISRHSIVVKSLISQWHHKSNKIVFETIFNLHPCPDCSCSFPSQFSPRNKNYNFPHVKSGLFFFFSYFFFSFFCRFSFREREKSEKKYKSTVRHGDLLITIHKHTPESCCNAASPWIYWVSYVLLRFSFARAKYAGGKSWRWNFFPLDSSTNISNAKNLNVEHVFCSACWL